RGGCSCAGPYGHRLLGIDLETSKQFEDVIATGCEVLKPGWVRLNFNYFISESEFDYIVEAVHMIASDGWRLLPLYTYEAETGVWRHRDGLPRPPASLLDADFSGSEPAPTTVSLDALDDYIEVAKRILSEAPLDDGIEQTLSTQAEELRWFPTPTEVGK
ncbi:MAG: aminotransferase, partial [Actinobacteria bacterium]|nr:aminotransferase [Actinomycetota bacterium]